MSAAQIENPFTDASAIPSSPEQRHPSKYLTIPSPPPKIFTSPPTNDSVSSFYSYDSRTDSQNGNLPSHTHPTQPPKVLTPPKKSASVSTFFSYDSKDAILPSHHAQLQTIKRLSAAQREYEAARIQSNLLLEKERRRDSVRRTRYNPYAQPTSPSTSSRTNPPTIWKFPLALLSTGMLSLTITLILILGPSPVSLTPWKLFALLASMGSVLGGGVAFVIWNWDSAWFMGEKGILELEREREVERERGKRGAREGREVRGWRYEEMGARGSVLWGHEGGVLGVGYEGLTPPKRTRSERVKGVETGSWTPPRTGREQDSDGLTVGADKGSWERDESPFVKGRNGSLFREEFEMQTLRVVREGEDPWIGVAM